MARAFRRQGSRVVGRLDELELQVVGSLLQQARDILAPEPGPVAGDPRPVEAQEQAAGGRDPVLERLLPPAHRTDEAQAAEFRGLTEDGLRGTKVATLQTAIAALEQAAPGTVELDEGQAQALAVALTDVRLIVAERLGLRTDEDADRLAEEAAGADDLQDPRVALIVYYDFLTWLQETITQALMQSQ